MQRLCILVLAALVGVQCLPPRPQTSSEDVGLQVASKDRLKIVGGHPVTIEDFPFQVCLEKDHDLYCGGSILSKEYVLLAAHCVYDDPDPARYTVRYGSTYWGKNGTVLNVTSIAMHDQYVRSKHKNDVAVLKLEADIVFSDQAQPTRLVAVGQEPRSTDLLVVSGWGSLHSSGYDSPDDLYAVTVPYIARSTCSITYGIYSSSIDDSMICAGIAGKDSCQADSGGPLTDALGQQVGVVSWGSGCGDEGYAGVYANLAHYVIRDWIRNQTGIA